MHLRELAGVDLGLSSVSYSARDAILYAIAVGAPADRLDLVYERDLRVLPTYACALGLWAVEKAGELGAYDRKRSLHVSQSLVMHGVMPVQGEIAMRGRIASVWDRKKATTLDVAVESDIFTATYTIFLPGVGDWGGPPAPTATEGAAETAGATRTRTAETPANLAALYRLTGDMHPIHIDPEIARANGFDRPILHGLCTLGIAARLLADATDAHPCDLREIKARLTAPVMPGDSIVVTAKGRDRIQFEAHSNQSIVLKEGRAIFGQ